MNTNQTTNALTTFFLHPINKNILDSYQAGLAEQEWVIEVIKIKIKDKEHYVNYCRKLPENSLPKAVSEMVDLIALSLELDKQAIIDDIQSILTFSQFDDKGMIQSNAYAMIMGVDGVIITNQFKEICTAMNINTSPLCGCTKIFQQVEQVMSDRFS